MREIFKRRKPKRVVDMTNEEAACFYVRRAQSAERAGNMARAGQLYKTAVLHDPNNAEARRGGEVMAAIIPNQEPYAASGSSSPAKRSDPRVRRKRRPWWKRALGIH